MEQRWGPRSDLCVSLGGLETQKKGKDQRTQGRQKEEQDLVHKEGSGEQGSSRIRLCGPSMVDGERSVSD